jgi:hypothetical protein
MCSLMLKSKVQITSLILSKITQILFSEPNLHNCNYFIITKSFLLSMYINGHIYNQPTTKPFSFKQVGVGNGHIYKTPFIWREMSSPCTLPVVSVKTTG